jgi:hypothetical protein
LGAAGAAFLSVTMDCQRELAADFSLNHEP